MGEVRTVGIIGFGAMGRRRLEALEALDPWRVVGVADIAETARNAVPAGITVVRDSEAVLALRPDAVVVAVTPDAAPEICALALRHGISVLCEKPPARSPSEFVPVLHASAASGSTLMIGFNHREHASVRAAMALVDAGTIGAVRHLDGVYTKTSAPPGWRADPVAAGGGILLDQGIHLLDLLRAFAGDLEVVRASASGPRGAEVEVLAELRGRGSSPIPAFLHSSAVAPHAEFSLRIVGEHGEIVLRGLVTPSGRYAPETLELAGERHVWVTDDSIERELRAFRGALDHPGCQTHGLPSDALAALELVQRVYDAAEWT